MNKRNPLFVRGLLGVALAVLALYGATGCVAFKIGEPEIISAEFQTGDMERKTLSRKVLSAGPIVSQKRDSIYVAQADAARGLGLGAAMSIPAGQGEVIIPGNIVRKYGIANALAFSDAFERCSCQTLHVGLGGTVRTREREIEAYRKFEIKSQRRLSFGFLPAFAEKRYRPEGCLYPLVGKYDKEGEPDFEKFEDGSSFYPLRGLFITPWSLLITPLFGDFGCQSHYWSGKNIDKLSLLPPEERERIAINTRPLTRKIATRGAIAHSSWLGFHRYENLSIGEEGFSRLVAKEATTNRAVYVTGPYLAEVRIPSLGYLKTQEIMPGESSEVFVLPSVQYDTAVDVVVRFLRPAYASKTIPDGDEQAVFEEAVGKTYGARIIIRGAVLEKAPNPPSRK